MGLSRSENPSQESCTKDVMDYPCADNPSYDCPLSPDPRSLVIDSITRDRIHFVDKLGWFLREKDRRLQCRLRLAVPAGACDLGRGARQIWLVIPTSSSSFFVRFIFLR